MDRCEGWIGRCDLAAVGVRARHWIKSKNPAAPAVKREAEEDWGR
jgi:hypothetical protein